MPLFPTVSSILGKVSKATEAITPTNISANMNKAVATAEHIAGQLTNFIVSTATSIVNQTINSAIGLVSTVIDTTIGIGISIKRISTELLSILDDAYSSIENFSDSISTVYNKDSLSYTQSVSVFCDSLENDANMLIENAVSQNNIVGSAITMSQNLTNNDIKEITASTNAYNAKINQITQQSKENYVNYASELSIIKGNEEKDAITMNMINNSNIEYNTENSIINIKNTKVQIKND